MYAENAGAIFRHPNDDYWKKKLNTQVVESGIHSGFRIRVLRVRISPWVPSFKKLKERQANVVVAAVLKTVRRLKDSCGFDEYCRNNTEHRRNDDGTKCEDQGRSEYSHSFRQNVWRVIRDGDRHRLLNEWKAKAFKVRFLFSPPKLIELYGRFDE